MSEHQDGSRLNTGRGRLVEITITAVLLIVAGWHITKINKADTPLIVLLVLAALPWLSRVFDEIAMPGGWKFKYRRLEEQLDRTTQAVDKLYALSMSSDTFNHLRTLAEQNKQGDVSIPSEPNSGMAGELNYLKLLGYIRFTGASGPDGVPVKGVGNLPPGKRTWEELYRYITVTETGRDFLTFREQFTGVKRG